MSSIDKKDPEIVRAIILDHYENPVNFIQDTKNVECYECYNSASPSCIDNLTAYVLVKDNKIEDIKFAGVGCAISTSSTDIMASLLKNKNLSETKTIIDNYLNMIDGNKYDEDILGELYSYENVNKQANRINCAKVGIIAIKKAIEKYESK